MLSVDNYKEMLRKLAFLAFIVGCICAVILRSSVEEIDVAVAKIDMLLPASLSEWIELPPLPIGTLAFGVIAAFLSHAFKLHDKLSSFLSLRHDFDIRWIMLPMAALSSTSMTKEKMDKLASQRHNIMKDVFYKYASSSEGRQVIDPHTITQALTNWSWFWFCLESCAFFLLTASILIFFGEWHASTWVLFFCLVLIVSMRLLRADSSKSAIAQVEEILSDPVRHTEIKARFDAL